MVYLLLVSTTSIYSSDITISFNPFSHIFPLYLLMLIISPTPMIQHFIKFDRNMHFMDGMHQNQDMSLYVNPNPFLKRGNCILTKSSVGYLGQKWLSCHNLYCVQSAPLSCAKTNYELDNGQMFIFHTKLLCKD